MDRINLPPDWTLITDKDEEIFLLYTQPVPSTSYNKDTTNGNGLGFVSAKDGVLSLELIITPNAMTTEQSKGKGRGKEKEVIVNVQLEQDLNGLRNRKGDTGSILWQSSISLAYSLLTSHHFPSSTPSLPLCKDWSTLSVLELGSGTGFLGIALRNTAGISSLKFHYLLWCYVDNGISKVKKWTYSDLLENLDLVERNLKRNDADARLESTVQTTKVKKKSNKRVVADQSEEEVMELDWLSVTTDDQVPKNSTEPVYDLILAVDTLYNPSLSVPLARTISHYATAAGTIVLVVTELREPEALELWLGEMLARGWSIVRVGDVTHGDARRAWIGWICWMR